MRCRSVKLLKLPNKKSPYWYLRWSEYSNEEKKWKQRWRSTRTTIKREAIAIRRTLERELDGGKVYEHELTWDEFVKLFMEKHAARKPLSTQMTYQQSLSAFSKIINPHQLASVSHALLEDFASG